jgi:hypothetical protein
MAIAGLSHEQETIRAFILKDRQERCAYLLGQLKHRHKFTNALAHFKWLDDHFAHPIPASTAHTAAELISLLRRKGAEQTVWGISEYASIDGQEMKLEEAMEEIWGDKWEQFFLVSLVDSHSSKVRKCGVSVCSCGHNQSPGRLGAYSQFLLGKQNRC